MANSAYKSNIRRLTNSRYFLTDGLNTVVPYEHLSYDESAYTLYCHVSSNAKKEGFLTKQGGFVHNWKRRWFVLTDGALYYFANRQPDEYPKGVIPLARGVTKVYESPNSVAGHPNYFEINPDPQYPSTRVYCLDADTPEEKKFWIRALQDVLGTN